VVERKRKCKMWGSAHALLGRESEAWSHVLCVSSTRNSEIRFPLASTPPQLTNTTKHREYNYAKYHSDGHAASAAGEGLQQSRYNRYVRRPCRWATGNPIFPTVLQTAPYAFLSWAYLLTYSHSQYNGRCRFKEAFNMTDLATPGVPMPFHGCHLP